MKLNILAKAITVAALAFSITGVSASQNVHAAEQNSFLDVKTGSWYETTVQWGVSNDIVKGYSDGTFKPNKTVTEAEFITMLIRAFEPNLSSANSRNWADAYYARAKELNYPVNSYTDINSRTKVILRKQVAELISSAEGVHFSGDHAIHYLLAFGLAEGSNPDEISIKSFNGNKALSRAEALKFIKSLSENGIGGLLERPNDASNPGDLPPLQF